MKQLFTWSLCLEATTLTENIGLGMLNGFGLCVVEYCDEGSMTSKARRKGELDRYPSLAFLSMRTVHTYVEKPAPLKL